jgi:predicted PurR-regulated permease PerM
MTGWIDRRTVSVLFTIGAVVGILALVYAARHTVVVLILSLLFAYLLEPAVVVAERWAGSRSGGIVITYGLLGIALAIFIAVVGSRIVSEGQKLDAALPDLLEKVSSGQIAWSVGSQNWSYPARQRIEQFLLNHREAILRYDWAVSRRALELLTGLSWIWLVPVLSIFFLKDRSGMGRSVVEMIEASHQRRFLRSILSDLDTTLAGYIRAQLLLSLLAMAAYTAFLLIIRFPYALAVAPIAGILEFIPLVGPLLAGVILLVIAFATGYPHWIVIVAFWVVWRLVQDYINMPRLMGRRLRLGPLLTITAVLAGGEIGGIIGMFLAIPAVAAVQVIYRNSVSARKFDEDAAA